jgi:hypothetical protein
MPYQKCPLTKEGGGQQLAPHLPAPPSFRFGFIGLFCGLGVGMINWHSSKAKIVHGPVLGLGAQGVGAALVLAGLVWEQEYHGSAASDHALLLVGTQV